MEADISGSILTIAETRIEMAMNHLIGGELCLELIIPDNLQVQNLEFSPFLKEQMLGEKIITVKENITTMKGTGQGACLVIDQRLYPQGLTGREMKSLEGNENTKRDIWRVLTMWRNHLVSLLLK